MGDVRVVWDNTTGTGDINIIGPSVELGHDLETAVLISLFTDATADPDDVLPPGYGADPRGWWADTYAADEDVSLTAIPNDRIGSKLWQIHWRTRNQDTLNWARDQALIALQWMITDGVAASIDVAPQFIGSAGVGLVVTITEPNGAVTPFTYAWTQEG